MWFNIIGKLMLIIQVVFRMSDPRPFGFTVYENSIYWADWLTKKIMTSDRHGDHQVTLQSNMGNVMDLTVFHRGRPNSKCNTNLIL